MGGDERQAQYDLAIENELQQHYPHITVEFCHPGWSSQWGRTLEDLKRQLEHCDGGVVSRFLRTEFARQLRKSLTVPWKGCYGTGKQAILNSIVQAALKGSSGHVVTEEETERQEATHALDQQNVSP